MKKFDNINVAQIVKVVTYIDMVDDRIKYIEPYKWLWVINRGGYWQVNYIFKSELLSVIQRSFI